MALAISLAVICFLCQAAKGIKVVESVHKLGEPESLSGARIREPAGPVNIRDMTICIRWNLKTLDGPGGRLVPISIGRDYDYEFYAKNSKEFIPEWLWVLVWEYDYGFVGLGHPRQRGSFKSWITFEEDAHGKRELYAANRWTHFCVAYRKLDGLVIIMRNGKEIGAFPAGQPDPEMTKVTFPQDLLSLINIGKCPHNSGASCATPEGEYTDVNLWSRALSRQELVDWTSCRSVEKGDVLNWDEAKLNLINMTEKEVSMDAICKPISPGHTMFPNKRSFHRVLSVCKQFKGSMSVVEDQETEVELTEKFAAHQDACKRTSGNWAFWNGWWDEPSEGTFINAVTNKPIGNYQPWAVGEPNGHNQENCAISWPQEKEWNDSGCQNVLCAFCYLPNVPTFTLRGLCPDSKFDTRYSWTGKFTNGYFSFRGFTHSSMSFDGQGEWRIELDGDPHSYLSNTSPDYPVGLAEWSVHNESSKCGNDTKTWLSMTACSVGEFNCRNGHCVEMEKRCNGVTDCEDTSDEIDCVVFEKSLSYLKNMPPGSSNKKNNNTTDVDLEAEILAVLDISEVDSLISMQIEMHLSWFDPRLTMIDLNAKPSLNFLPLERRNEIWLPEVVFYNTEVKSETLNDGKAFAVISRASNYTRRSVESLKNTYEYQGDQNPIKLSRVYSAKFICDYNMRMYPFDKQECSAIFTMKGKFDEFVRLRGKNSSYLGPIDLPQYYVTGTKIFDTVVPPGTKAVEINIFFGRRILSTMLSSYVPTFLICLLTFCTNYFRGYYFEAIVTVNLTSMLVLTTLFIGIMDSLPQTSYIKMIDVWNMFCLTIPFLAVTIQTFLEHNSEHDPRQDVMVNHHGHVRLVKDRKNEVNENANVGINRIDVLPAAGSAESEMPPLPISSDNGRRKTSVRVAHFLVKWGLPSYFFGFSFVYFIVGFANSQG